MSFAELLEKVETLSSEERKELMKVLREAEQQDEQKSNAEQTENKPRKTFAEAAAHLIGSIKDGLPTDISTNKKYLEDLGRD